MEMNKKHMEMKQKHILFNKTYAQAYGARKGEALTEAPMLARILHGHLRFVGA